MPFCAASVIRSVYQSVYRPLAKGVWYPPLYNPCPHQSKTQIIPLLTSAWLSPRCATSHHTARQPSGRKKQCERHERTKCFAVAAFSHRQSTLAEPSRAIAEALLAPWRCSDGVGSKGDCLNL